MGYYAPSVHITASLSRHNSRRDQIDNLLYEEAVDRIREVLNDTRYVGLGFDLIGDGIDWRDG